MARNYYTLLHVSETASPEEIREAYRRLAKLYHPDTSGNDTARTFELVQEAWETLRDSGRRKAYDREMESKRRSRTERARVDVRPGSWAEASGTPDVQGLGPSPSEPIFELTMSAAEAASGGRIAVRLAVLRRCPECAYFGPRPFCPTCAGRGSVLREEEYTLLVPGGLAQGELVQLPLVGIGLPTRRLAVYVRILD
jgi:molecular chaperone DnaJ